MENNKTFKSRKFWLAVSGVAISLLLILAGKLIGFDYLQAHTLQFYIGMMTIILGYMGVNGLINLFKK